jgi:hypothetical protein
MIFHHITPETALFMRFRYIGEVCHRLLTILSIGFYSREQSKGVLHVSGEMLIGVLAISDAVSRVLGRRQSREASAGSGSRVARL